MSVLALESAIITHGMPAEAITELMATVDERCRSRGVLPAIFFVWHGRLKVTAAACATAHLAELSAAKSHRVVKLSSRDLPLALGDPATSGGTTIAATATLASSLGIPVFVTGGFGGVHLGGESTMDVSADLAAMSHAAGLIVVCAGVKAILDVGRTLEVLESLEVPTIAFGTDDWPGFIARTSGHRAPARVDTVADLLRVRDALTVVGSRAGLMVATPIPAADEVPFPVVRAATEAALAASGSLSGQDVTPVLLAELVRRTDGASLRANQVLFLHNLDLGINVALADAASSSSSSSSSHSVLVAGGAALDTTATVPGLPRRFPHDSLPGAVRSSVGGVGANVATAAAAAAPAGTVVSFATVLGDDEAGATVARLLGRRRVRLLHPLAVGTPTCRYLAIASDADVALGVADFSSLDDSPPSAWEPAAAAAAAGDAVVVVIDANLPLPVAQCVARGAVAGARMLWLEPVSATKAQSRVAPLLTWLGTQAAAAPATPLPLIVLSPNVTEILALAAGRAPSARAAASATVATVRGAAQRVIAAAGAAGPRLVVIVTGGPKGALVVRQADASSTWIAPPRVVGAAGGRASGAGDALAGALAARWAGEASVAEWETLLRTVGLPAAAAHVAGTAGGDEAHLARL